MDDRDVVELVLTFGLAAGFGLLLLSEHTFLSFNNIEYNSDRSLTHYILIGSRYNISLKSLIIIFMTSKNVERKK